MTSKEIIEDAMVRTRLDMQGLASRLGKKLRTLKGIRSGEFPMPADMHQHIQDLVKLHELTATRIGFSATPRVEEDDGAGGARGLLKRLRLDAQLSIADLAEKAGVKAETVRRLETGETGGNEEVLTRLATALGVEPQRLMEGSDSPVLAGAGTTFGSTPRVVTESDASARTIPLLSWAQAGEGAWEDNYEHEAIVVFNVKDPKAIAIKIRGDSMAPQFPEGTMAVCYPSRTARSGDLVVARLTDGNVMFKRYESAGDKANFISLNPVYPPIVVDRSKVEKIIPVGFTQSPPLL